MKDLASKAFKFIAASLGVLVTAYTLGWSGAITLHSLFKSEKVEAESFVMSQVSGSESKLTAIHNADIAGINRSLDILIEQNKLIISQNYRTRKAIENNTP